MGMVKIELTEDEFASLLIMSGYAAGAASRHDPQLRDSFIRLANAINRDNPRWTPYAMPDREDANAAQGRVEPEGH